MNGCNSRRLCEGEAKGVFTSTAAHYHNNGLLHIWGWLSALNKCFVSPLRTTVSTMYEPLFAFVP